MLKNKAKIKFSTNPQVTKYGENLSTFLIKNIYNIYVKIAEMKRILFSNRKNN